MCLEGVEVNYHSSWGFHMSLSVFFLNSWRSSTAPPGGRAGHRAAAGAPAPGGGGQGAAGAAAGGSQSCESSEQQPGRRGWLMGWWERYEEKGKQIDKKVETLKR